MKFILNGKNSWRHILILLTPISVDYLGVCDLMRQRFLSPRIQMEWHAFQRIHIYLSLHLYFSRHTIAVRALPNGEFAITFCWKPINRMPAKRQPRKKKNTHINSSAKSVVSSLSLSLSLCKSNTAISPKVLYKQRLRGTLARRNYFENTHSQNTYLLSSCRPKSCKKLSSRIIFSWGI